MLRHGRGAGVNGGRTMVGARQECGCPLHTAHRARARNRRRAGAPAPARAHARRSVACENEQPSGRRQRAHVNLSEPTQRRADGER
eukprot:4533228-Prymnesium_polylepis.1